LFQIFLKRAYAGAQHRSYQRLMRAGKSLLGRFRPVSSFKSPVPVGAILRTPFCDVA